MITIDFVKFRLRTSMGWENQLERLKAILSSPQQMQPPSSHSVYEEELQQIVADYLNVCSANLDSAPRAAANGSPEAIVSAFCSQREVWLNSLLEVFGRLKRKVMIVKEVPAIVFSLWTPLVYNRLSPTRTFYVDGAVLNLDGSLGVHFSHQLRLSSQEPTIVQTPVCEYFKSCEVLDISRPGAEERMFVSVLRPTDGAVLELPLPNTVFGAALYALWEEEGEEAGEGEPVRVNLVSMMGNTLIEAVCVDGVVSFSFLTLF
eukprot:GILI01017652.1.p1 GENE.GILI01017652.1~~GILI01017652.1.p1  ORF type:complete len:261 (-),score=23.88 GILI01017652.1:1597-2379(-)